MPRSAQWIVHNTNHWGAVRPNMIPGKIRAPTLTAHGTQVGRWPSPTSGSSKNISSDRMIVLRRKLTVAMERNWMQFFRALIGRSSCNSHLALTLWQVGPHH